MFGFLLMAAMHGLLDFGSDKNAFVAIGQMMVHDLVVHGVQRLVTLEVD